MLRILDRIYMNLQEKIHKTVAEVFEIPLDEVHNEMTPFDIKKWDSLGQLTLISAIEKKLNIFFETADIFKIISIQSIIDIVDEKVHGGT